MRLAPYALPLILVLGGLAGVAFAAGNPTCQLTVHYSTVPDGQGGVMVVATHSCVDKGCVGGCTEVGGPPGNPTPGTFGAVKCKCGQQPYALCRIGNIWFVEEDGTVTWTYLSLCTQEGCPQGQQCEHETQIVIGPSGFWDAWCECK